MQSIYQDIYEIVRRIPAGKVSTYGRIAKMLPNCTPRMVGYAMAALPADTDVPWQRIVNVQGEISLRSYGDHDVLQQQLLISEGIQFDHKDRIDLEKYLWLSP